MESCDIDTGKILLHDMYARDWSRKIFTVPKLRTYVTFKTSYTTVVKHVINDFCFVDVMEAAILKILLARRRFSLFYDTEKRLPGNKWSSGVFKQHFLKRAYWRQFWG